jgi:hypothetical protein
LDPKIPKWSKLPNDALTSLKQTTSNHKQVLLRETGDQIGENLLAEKGYSLNGHITEVATGHIYMISSFGADGVSASLKLMKPAVETKSKKGKKNTTDTECVAHGIAPMHQLASNRLH